MNPKISIIVPVYKVEMYIHKCIDSVLAQTFTDFELILVDDGSPDNCGRICDEYAKKDSRIVVIHKENGGQSSARNVGLDIAKGDYVGFVDSDDWIEPDMYEILYNVCTEHDCDIANCSSTIYFKDRTIVNGGHPLTIHDRQEAMKTMLEGKLYDECLWTKLIKRNLLEDIRIPNGIMYEDTAFTYKFMHRAKRVGCIGVAKYNYIKRDDSTMDRAIKNISIDAPLIYEEMYTFINDNYPDLSDIVALKLANRCMIVLNLMINSDRFIIYKDDYYRIAKNLSDKFSETIALKDYPRNVKVLLLLNKIHPNLYKIAIEKIGRKNSV